MFPSVDTMNNPFRIRSIADDEAFSRILRFIFVPHPKDLEAEELTKVTLSLEIYYDFTAIGGVQKSAAISAAVAQLGPKVICQRLHTLILDERYTVPGYLTYIIDLFCAFTTEKAVRIQLMKAGLHVALVKRAWSLLKPRRWEDKVMPAGLCLWGLGR